MSLDPGIKAAKQKVNLPKILHSHLSYYNSTAPITNVEVKNIGSGGFTQLISVRTIIKCLCPANIVVYRSKIKSIVFSKEID